MHGQCYQDVDQRQLESPPAVMTVLLKAPMLATATLALGSIMTGNAASYSGIQEVHQLPTGDGQEHDKAKPDEEIEEVSRRARDSKAISRLACR